MSPAEKACRDLWTAQGVPPDQQDRLIAGITAKAQPGARVGPFTIRPLIVSTGPEDDPEADAYHLGRGVL